MKAIAVLISPKGKRFYAAYGPMVPNKKQATRFDDTRIAERAALGYFGRARAAFWESERRAQNRAFEEYRGWKYTVESVKR